MPIGFEAAGDALTGAVIGRAVEPDHGQKVETGHGPCLNCGATLMGSHCHQCGQAAHVHRTLAVYGHDLLHGVFHIEGKILRTLPMLAFKPGELTRRYIHGERAKFVSPLALFLFSVFLMFAVFETVGGPIPSDKNGKNEFSFSTVAKQSEDKLTILMRDRAKLAAERKDLTKIDAEIADERDGRDFFIQVQKMVEGKPYKLKTDFGFDTGSAALDDSISQAVRNPKLLLYKLQSSAYKFAWALMPLSLPFMWLMFAWRPQFKLYDHAVFVTYSITFVMLLLIVMAFVGALGLKPTALTALVPVHFFSQLKGAYSLSWRSALWRTVALLCVSAFVLVAFGLFLLALGLMG